MDEVSTQDIQGAWDGSQDFGRHRGGESIYCMRVTFSFNVETWNKEGVRKGLWVLR